MTNITFVGTDGARFSVNAENGLSLMQAALHHDVPGIVAECGGCAACGTCQVHIGAAWIDRIPQAEPLEASVLAESENDHTNLRLSCQIMIDATLEGMVVEVAAGQR